MLLVGNEEKDIVGGLASTVVEFGDVGEVREEVETVLVGFEEGVSGEVQLNLVGLEGVCILLQWRTHGGGLDFCQFAIGRMKLSVHALCWWQAEAQLVGCDCWEMVEYILWRSYNVACHA